MLRRISLRLQWIIAFGRTIRINQCIRIRLADAHKSKTAEASHRYRWERLSRKLRDFLESRLYTKYYRPLDVPERDVPSAAPPNPETGAWAVAFCAATFASAA